MTMLMMIRIIRVSQFQGAYEMNAVYEHGRETKEGKSHTNIKRIILLKDHKMHLVIQVVVPSSIRQHNRKPTNKRCTSLACLIY